MLGLEQAMGQLLSSPPEQGERLGHHLITQPWSSPVPGWLERFPAQPQRTDIPAARGRGKPRSPALLAPAGQEQGEQSRRCNPPLLSVPGSSSGS